MHLNSYKAGSSTTPRRAPGGSRVKQNTALTLIASICNLASLVCGSKTHAS